MKTKLFTKSNPLAQRGKKTIELEREINGWLENHPTIEIDNIAQSFGGNSNNTQELVISVWYRDSAEIAGRKLNSEPQTRSSVAPSNR